MYLFADSTRARARKLPTREPFLEVATAREGLANRG